MIKTYYKYIDEWVVTDLLERVKNKISEKAGTNSSAFVFEDYVVLKTGNLCLKDTELYPQDMIPFNIIVEKLQTLKNNGVNVVPILGYLYDDEKTSHFKSGKSYGKGFIFQPRAKGSELWDGKFMPSPYTDGEVTIEEKDYLLNRIKKIACAPLSQYEKFVSDFKAICDANVAVDPSKKENFFYDEKQGFSFIDLNFEGNILGVQEKFENEMLIHYCIYLACLTKYTNKYLMDNFTKEEIKQISEANIKILTKCRYALIKNGCKEDVIDFVVSGYYRGKKIQEPLNLTGINNERSQEAERE